MYSNFQYHRYLLNKRNKFYLKNNEIINNKSNNLIININFKLKKYKKN